MGKDYYAVLGVSKDAGEDDLKRAYRRAGNCAVPPVGALRAHPPSCPRPRPLRKLAVKYHPDKNQGNKAAEEQFKEVGEAYHVLSNPETRKVFDAYGEEGLKGGLAGRGSRLQAAPSVQLSGALACCAVRLCMPVWPRPGGGGGQHLPCIQPLPCSQPALVPFLAAGPGPLHSPPWAPKAAQHALPPAPTTGAGLPPL
jgi:hypothetical protein